MTTFRLFQQDTRSSYVNYTDILEINIEDAYTEDGHLTQEAIWQLQELCFDAPEGHCWELRHDRSGEWYSFLTDEATERTHEATLQEEADREAAGDELATLTATADDSLRDILRHVETLPAGVRHEVLLGLSEHLRDAASTIFNSAHQ